MTPVLDEYTHRWDQDGRCMNRLDTPYFKLLSGTLSSLLHLLFHHNHQCFVVENVPVRASLYVTPGRSHNPAVSWRELVHLVQSGDIGVETMKFPTNARKPYSLITLH